MPSTSSTNKNKPCLSYVKERKGLSMATALLTKDMQWTKFRWSMASKRRKISLGASGRTTFAGDGRLVYKRRRITRVNLLTNEYIKL